MGIRKNQNSLSASDKRAFINAVLELKRRGVYDDFVRTHNAFILSDQDDGVRVGHRSPSFGPWHRKLLLEFEHALQAVDPAVTLPYWDWTTDRSPTSSLWAPDFLGGDGRNGDRQVMTGPFAYKTGKWTLTVRVDSRPYLRRGLGAGGGTLPTAADVRQVLAVTPYDAAPWNSASVESFRNQLEGWQGPDLHNRVHVWVGGHMASGVSPSDPVFWLHHCFVDKLWADWQAAHPDQGYLPAAGTPDVVGLDDRMRPWGDASPRDMLDHKQFYEYA
jgi:tyrosinase